MLGRASYQKILARKEEYIKLLEDVCRIETPSGNARAVTEAMYLLGEHARANGLQVRYDDSFPKAGDCAVITLVRESNLPPLVLMAHIDTVHAVGSFGEEPVSYEDDWMCGPGTVDCKGGAVMALAVLEAMATSGEGERTVKLLLTSDEEVSALYSGLDAFLAFLKKETAGAEAVFNCEVGREGKIVVGRKGILCLGVRVTGVAAHAGSCATEGASAIREMANIILALEAHNGKDDVTFNCGIIRGGDTVNIVPALCEMEVDVRFESEASRIRAMQIFKEAISHQTVQRTKVSFEEKSLRYAMPRTDEGARLAAYCGNLSKALNGKALEPIFVAGGADSAYTATFGIPTVCGLGPCGAGVHAKNERVSLSSFFEKAELLAACLCNFNFNNIET